MKGPVLGILATASACLILSACSTSRPAAHIGSINQDQSHSVLECWREIADLLPPGVELTDLSYQKPEEVKLAGVGVNVSDVYDFKKGLESSQLFVGSTLSGPRYEQQKRQVFDLTLTLPRDNPKGAPLATFVIDKDLAAHWLIIVESLAVKYGLNFTQREVGAEKAVGDAIELPIDIKWEGSDESLVRFLFTLQMENPTVNVRQLLIRKGEKGLLRGHISMVCRYTRDVVSGKTRGTNNAPAVASGPTGPTMEKGAGAERYQIIIERKTFGSPPPLPPPSPVLPVASNQTSFASDIRLTGLMETDRGVTAAFARNKGGRSIMLHVGDVEDGFELIKADMEQGTALLKRGNEEVWFVLGPLAPATKSAPAALVNDTNLIRQTYAERLRMRREALRVRNEQPKLTGEELKKHLQEYQMNLIRSGMAPLPLPLTPEMDKQLVEEGVLPPP